jgi:septum formation protein
MQKKLVLASLSPRRKQLLTQVGIEFEILGVDADERTDSRLSPAQNAENIALKKGQAAAPLAGGAAVLAADTMVVVDERILGKPRDEADAAQMLTLLQGRWHEVVTGYALILPHDPARTGRAVTRVRFAPMAPDAIERYITKYRPMDKAGAYGIQDGMARYICGVEGCFYNVMGLPIERVCRLLHEAGIIPE